MTLPQKSAGPTASIIVERELCPDKDEIVATATVSCTAEGQDVP